MADAVQYDLRNRLSAGQRLEPCFVINCRAKAKQSAGIVGLINPYHEWTGGFHRGAIEG